MQQSLLCVTILLIVKCKGSNDGIQLAPYSSSLTIGGHKVTEKDDAAALTQPSVATSALNSLAGIIAKGGNYIIDASAIGGGILIGKNGQVLPLASVIKGSEMNDGTAISPQLLQNLHSSVLQKQSSPPLTRATNPILKVFPELSLKPQSLSIPPKRYSFPRPVSTPVVKSIYRSVPKYKPVPISHAVRAATRLPYVIPDFSLLNFLDVYSGNYEVDFD